MDDIKMLDVFTPKENCKYSILNLENDKFILFEFAVPIGLYANRKEDKQPYETIFLVRAFYPDRYEPFGITIYTFTEEQFKDTFEKIGYYQDFLKK